MSLQLRGGVTVEDPRLGRIPEFDERSRNFPVRGALFAEGLEPRKRAWRCDVRLDQGAQPRCVGYAWATDAAAAPRRRKASNALGDEWYALAQRNDEWAGENYGGSSTLGGAKAAVLMGYASGYRWCFGLDDVIQTVSHYGPVLTGTNWYRGMSRTDDKGFVQLTGPLDGGHEWCIRGVDPERELLIGRQTWGYGWGFRGRGDFYVSFTDYARLLREHGDACSPVRI